MRLAFTLAWILGCTLAAPLATRASTEGTSPESTSSQSDTFGVVRPGDVWQIAGNVNEALLEVIAHEHPARFDAARAMEAHDFADKRPEDCFRAAQRFAERLDRLRRPHGLEAIPSVLREKMLAIPAEVYLQVGYLLDGAVELAAVRRPSETFGHLYVTRDPVTAKTPSDVFSLIDLASRRAELVLSGVTNPGLATAQAN